MLLRWQECLCMYQVSTNTFSICVYCLMISLLNINVGCTLQYRRLRPEYEASAAISSTLELYYFWSFITNTVISKIYLDLTPLSVHWTVSGFLLLRLICYVRRFCWSHSSWSPWQFRLTPELRYFLLVWDCWIQTACPN